MELLRKKILPILCMRNIVKQYHTNRQTIVALDNVTFSIHRGEIFCLLGVNGAGKTTLSSIIATLHPPTSGDIVCNGKSIYSNLMHYRRMLGFCPQRQNLDPDLTVKENLLFAGRYFLLPKGMIQERIAKLMRQFEIERYADFMINELSGGNQQRTLIARALMHNPKIVVLDEPTMGLDPDIRRKLWEYIILLKQMGITVILTTHYLEEAEYLADRVCILHDGKIVTIASVKELKEKEKKENLEDIFLALVGQQRDI